MKYAAMLLLIICNSISWAAIYMQKDADGNITYSDTPLPNSKVINVPENKNTVTKEAPPAEQKPATDNTVITTEEGPPPQPGETREAYATFLIVSPKDQETIQNQPTVPVEIQLKPALQNGDEILMLVDNKPWGQPSTSTHLQLDQVDRGTRQIAAVILDKNQKIIKQSNTVTIYIHRVTLNSPSRPPP